MSTAFKPIFYIPYFSVDTKGPKLACPEVVYGFVNDSNDRISVQWKETTVAYDIKDAKTHPVTCRGGNGELIRSGDYFEAGTINVTCVTMDDDGNYGLCTYFINITGW